MPDLVPSNRISNRTKQTFTLFMVLDILLTELKHFVLSFRTLDLYMPAHMEVYEEGELLLPGKVRCYNAINTIHGTIGGITELTLIHTTMNLTATSMSQGSSMAGRYEINNINVMAGGVLELTGDIATELTLSSGTLHIAPTGIVKAKQLTVTADNINIEEGGTIDLDEMGYGTEGTGIY